MAKLPVGASSRNVLPVDPNVAYIGWTEHTARGTSTAYAIRVPAVHADAWRTHLDKRSEDRWARATPGALHPDMRRFHYIADRWPNNGTVLTVKQGAPPADLGAIGNLFSRAGTR